MKKVLVILLVTAFVLSMSGMAFALDGFGGFSATIASARGGNATAIGNISHTYVYSSSRALGVFGSATSSSSVNVFNGGLAFARAGDANAQNIAVLFPFPLIRNGIAP